MMDYRRSSASDHKLSDVSYESRQQLYSRSTIRRLMFTWMLLVESTGIKVFMAVQCYSGARA